MNRTLKITGMSCGHCTEAVEKALTAVPGVTGVTVDLHSKTASVTVDESVRNDTLIAAVNNTGFEVVSVE